MAEFKLALDTPATFVHGVTGRDVGTTILPAGTRYDFDGESNPFQDEHERTRYILVYGDDTVDGAVSLYRYRVLDSELSGIAI